MSTRRCRCTCTSLYMSSLQLAVCVRCDFVPATYPFVREHFKIRVRRATLRVSALKIVECDIARNVAKVESLSTFATLREKKMATRFHYLQHCAERSRTTIRAFLPADNPISTQISFFISATKKVVLCSSRSLHLGCELAHVRGSFASDEAARTSRRANRAGETRRLVLTTRATQTVAVRRLTLSGHRRYFVLFAASAM